MNSIGSFLHRDANNFISIQVRFKRLIVFTHLIGFVCFIAVLTVSILIGVNTYGFKIEFNTGPKDPYGDLSTIGNEDLREHPVLSVVAPA